jgi:hypothetical protein
MGQMMKYKSASCDLPLYSYYNDGMGSKYFCKGVQWCEGCYSNYCDYDLLLTYPYITKCINEKHKAKLPFSVTEISKTATMGLNGDLSYCGCTSLVISHDSKAPSIVKIAKSLIKLDASILVGIAFTELNQNYTYRLLFQTLEGQWIKYELCNTQSTIYNETSVQNGPWISKKCASLFQPTLHLKAIYIYALPKSDTAQPSTLRIGYLSILNGLSSSDGIVGLLNGIDFSYAKEKKYTGNYKITLSWKQWTNYSKMVKCMQVLQ